MIKMGYGGESPLTFIKEIIVLTESDPEVRVYVDMSRHGFEWLDLCDSLEEIGFGANMPEHIGGRSFIQRFVFDDGMYPIDVVMFI